MIGIVNIKTVLAVILHLRWSGDSLPVRVSSEEIITMFSRAPIQEVSKSLVTQRKFEISTCVSLQIWTNDKESTRVVTMLSHVDAKMTRRLPSDVHSDVFFDV